MRVQFVSLYFPPEIEPSAAKIGDLARKLAERGHQVSVITGFPNYPSGTIPEEYRGKLCLRESRDGVDVLRTFIVPAANRGVWRRLVGQFSFVISAVPRGALAGQPDVVVASSPPLEAGIAGYVLSRIKKVPFVFEVRDAWPKAAVVLGLLRNKRMIAFAESIERSLYRGASRVVAVTQGVRDHVIARGVPEDKLVLIPNGADTDLFQPDGRDAALRAEYGLTGKCTVTYAGTHGLQASLQSVLKAATLLQGDDDISFLFIGDGSEKPALMRASQQAGLSNVAFLDQQPRERLAKFLAATDVGIVHTRDDPFFQGYLPVKMFDYMAAGCPVVLGANGESKTLLETAQAGIWVGPENPEGMAQAIKRLCRDPELRRQLGRNGREYVVAHHSREQLARQYASLLASVVAERG